MNRHSGMTPLDRRAFVGASLAAGAALLGVPESASGSESSVRLLAASLPRGPAPLVDDLLEHSVAELGALMQRGALTSRELTQRFLTRIAQMDKTGVAINAVIELNPDALAMAEQCDTERKTGATAGPMHGIPVLIKENTGPAKKGPPPAGSGAPPRGPPG